MTNTDIVYRYLFDRTNPRAPYVPGLPARDIAEHELFENPDWDVLIQANLQSGGAIWEKVEPKAAQKTISKVKAEEKTEEGDLLS